MVVGVDWVVFDGDDCGGDGGVVGENSTRGGGSYDYTYGMVVVKV